MGCLGDDDTFISPVVKYILFFFNFICWMCGGVLIGVGIWAMVERSKYYQTEILTIYDVFTDVSIVLIVFGIIIFLIACAGCIGALRENVCLLKVYYYSMVVIFLLLVICAVLAFVYRSKARDFLHELLKENLITTYQDEADRQAVIDWVQENFQCCGVESYKDWNKNEYYNCSGTILTNTLRCSVPHSCCRKQDNINAGVTNILCGKDALSPRGDLSLIYTIGCIDATLNLVETNLPLVGGLVIGFAVPLLCGITLSRTLEGQILDQQARWMFQQ